MLIVTSFTMNRTMNPHLKLGIDASSCLNGRGEFVGYVCLMEELSNETFAMGILLSFITHA